MALVVSVMVSAFAQVPQKFSYQAVVRNESNTLVRGVVGVRVSILQGDVNGNAVYVETHSTTTNTNGLMTLQIGDGTAVSGEFATIDWANGPYFLKTETDPDGGTNYTIEGTQQLLSVPYALYAEDVRNVSNIQNIIENSNVSVSTFTNDAGYITANDLPAYQILSIINDTIYLTNGGWVVLPAGFDGDYYSLTNRPDLFSGDYNDLSNTPTIPTVPENVSTFTNDAGYITASDLPAYQILSIINDTIYLTNGGWVVLPAGFDGDYNSLTNRPDLFSGDYNDLSNTPTIPTVPENVSTFTNDAHYVDNANCSNMSFCDLANALSQLQEQYNALQERVVDLSNSTCGTTTVTDVDSNTYHTVLIGNQCWMKENLKTTKYADGTPIENGSATSYDVAYWYYPNNVEANKATYGLLYNWKATMRDAASTTANPSNVQGICPGGWHLPSDAEWKQMEMEVGMSQSDANYTGYRGNIAAKLSGNTGWNSSTNANAAGNLGAPDRNSSGFSALPAGLYLGSYNYFGNYACFWSATETSSTNAYGRSLAYGAAGVGRIAYDKTNGFSVRCVRDF